MNDAIAKGARFDGCTTYFEDAVVLCTRVAEALGLSLNPGEAFFKARNKRKTREAMMDAGLITPRLCKICDAGLRRLW